MRRIMGVGLMVLALVTLTQGSIEAFEQPITRIAQVGGVVHEVPDSWQMRADKVQLAHSLATLARKKQAHRRSARKRLVRAQLRERRRAAFRWRASGRCEASYYHEPQGTASGERFNPEAMTAAHKTLPLGSRVRVRRVGTNETVTVRINDRGPYVGGRCLDLSRGAMRRLGGIGAGVIPVEYSVRVR